MTRALPGHLGEWIAAQVFGIELERHATAKGIDGRFADGRTVNIKWYLKREGLLDLCDDGPDLYPRRHPAFEVTDEQRAMLALLGS